MENDQSSDFAQLMLLVDAPSNSFRGAMLLVVQGDSRHWQFYDAELFDGMDHIHRFVSDLLRSKYGFQKYMVLLCSVKESGWISTFDPASN